MAEEEEDEDSDEDEPKEKLEEIGEEEEQGSGDEEAESRNGKRRLQHKGNPHRRRSVRAAGGLEHNYAEREHSKRQRKASMPLAGVGSGSESCGVAAAFRKRLGGKQRECDHPGCTTQPTFGMVGSKKREFCSKHAKPGIVNVKSKMCGHPRCTMQPAFGMVGSKKAEFCFKHAKRGMVNIRRSGK